MNCNCMLRCTLVFGCFSTVQATTKNNQLGRSITNIGALQKHTTPMTTFIETFGQDQAPFF